MSLGGMISKTDPLSAQSLTRDVAHVAKFCLVGVSGFSFFSQTAEGVKHQTADDISEHHLKEDEVDHVETEPNHLEVLHGFSNSAGYIELTDTSHNWVAHVSNFVGRSIDILHVITESDSVEDVCENDT